MGEKRSKASASRPIQCFYTKRKDGFNFVVQSEREIIFIKDKLSQEELLRLINQTLRQQWTLTKGL